MAVTSSPTGFLRLTMRGWVDGAIRSSLHFGSALWRVKSVAWQEYLGKFRSLAPRDTVLRGCQYNFCQWKIMCVLLNPYFYQQTSSQLNTHLHKIVTYLTYLPNSKSHSFHSTIFCKKTIILSYHPFTVPYSNPHCDFAIAPPPINLQRPPRHLQTILPTNPPTYLA